MAESATHKWGQIIGNLLENAFYQLLHLFADAHNLYLDRRGKRAIRSSNDIIWTDARGNRHKLDYIMERGGTETVSGRSRRLR